MGNKEHMDSTKLVKADTGEQIDYLKRSAKKRKHKLSKENDGVDCTIENLEPKHRTQKTIPSQGCVNDDGNAKKGDGAFVTADDCQKERRVRNNKNKVNNHVDDSDCVDSNQQMTEITDVGKDINNGKFFNDSTAIGSQKARRLRKKEKKKRLKADNIHRHETRGHNKALKYLNDWQQHQENSNYVWKFEKCRQIWLLQHVYNDSSVSDTEFDILLKYIGSIQGKMRIMTLDSAKAKLQAGEKWQALANEGKLNPEIAEELGVESKPSEKTLRRAARIVESLT